MGFLSSPSGSAALDVVSTFALPEPPATAVEPAPRPVQYPSAIERQLAIAKAERWFAAEAEAIPAVRKALHVIVGTASSFALSAWRGNEQLAQFAVPWVTQPDPDRTSQAMLSRTIRAGIWHDLAVWRKIPGGFRFVRNGRLTRVDDESDPDAPPRYLIDGQPTPQSDLVVFDFAGFGGLRTYGVPLLDIFQRLMVATGRYADDPVPSTVLKNTGRDVDEDTIDGILNRWEAQRAVHSTGFLNAYLDLKTVGYSARDLQLVETMEAATKDVARLFGLPGFALGVDEGSSMTYANVTDRRRDVIDALRPWTSPIVQTLSMDEFVVQITEQGATAVRRGRYVPLGTDVRFDVDDYLREGFVARIGALTQALSTPAVEGALMTLGEARRLEPTIPNPETTL